MREAAGRLATRTASMHATRTRTAISLYLATGNMTTPQSGAQSTARIASLLMDRHVLTSTASPCSICVCVRVCVCRAILRHPLWLHIICVVYLDTSNTSSRTAPSALCILLSL